MRAAGVDSVVRADELSILGLWEIAHALPKFWSAFGQLKRAAAERRPDAAILVDWPDFNLRLARWLHPRGIPVIYYVRPQLWAWRSYPARTAPILTRRQDVQKKMPLRPYLPGGL